MPTGVWVEPLGDAQPWQKRWKHRARWVRRWRERPRSSARPAVAATPAGPRGASEPSCPAGRRKPRGGGGPEPEPLPGRWEGDNGREEGSREAAGPGHRTQRLAKAGKGKRDGRKGRWLKEESAKWPRLRLREGTGTGSGHSLALPGATGAPGTPRVRSLPEPRPSARAGAKIIRNTANCSQVMSRSQDPTALFSCKCPDSNDKTQAKVSSAMQIR